MIDLQKGSLWKRVSAALFDFILLVMLVVGAATGLSAITQFDKYHAVVNDTYKQYAIDYNVTATQEEIDAMTEEEFAEYEERVNAAEQALYDNTEFVRAWQMTQHLPLLIVTFSVLFSILLLEFVVPLLFGNGQTLGKKIFGIALMRVDGIKVTALQMFVRTILGKFAIELMIPIFLFINLYYFHEITLVGVAVILLLLIAQILCLVRTKTLSLLHDVMAGTVAVDFASQMIFDTKEDQVRYISELHAKEAADAAY